MERWVGKVAVVTGASAGIGTAITQKLVQEGVIVAGFARRKERVETLAKKLQGAKGKLHPVKIDISNEHEIVQGFEWVKTNLGPIHILVNNAGVLRNSSLGGGDSQEWRDVFDTNVFGLCVATREAVKDMKTNNVNGHIIHINSIAGHKALPGTNVYSASKFAVTALADTLRYEFNKDKLKIKITSISPGYVKTEIMEAGGIQLPEDFLINSPSLNPEDIADGVLYALGTPPHVQVKELMLQPVGEEF